MKDKIFKILITIFALLFLIYPTSYGITDMKISFIFLFLLIPLLFLIKKIKIKIPIKEKYYPLIIFFLTLLSRLIVVLIFNPYISQVSNFKDALDGAMTLDFSSNFYRIFNHWTLYPAMLNVIFKIFGSSQLVALLTNAVLLSINSVLIYKIGSLLLNKKSGVLSALIYIIWPSNILYTLIVNPENFGILLLLSSLYLFIKLEKNQNSKNINQYKKIIYLIVIGLLLGVSVFFKNFALVFIIAFVIYYILNIFKTNNIKQYIVKRLFYIIIICLTFSLSSQITSLVVDNIVGTRVSRNIIPGFLNIGLRGDGTLSENRWVVYEALLEKYNYDFDLANEEMLESIIDDIKDSNSNVRQKGFFDNKANILFNGDHGKLDYVSESLKEGNHIRIINILNNKIIPLNNVFYTIIITLMGIGLIFLIRKKDLEVLLLYIIIFGVALMLLIVEAQNRYMYSIQPLMCILATYAVINMKNKIVIKNN